MEKDALLKHKKDLIDIYKKNLRVLEKRETEISPEFDLGIANQIDNIRSLVSQLQQEVLELEKEGQNETELVPAAESYDIADENEKPIKNDNTQDNPLGSIEVQGNISGNIVIGSNNFIVYSNPLEQPADIFISYARTDAEIVRELYESLVGKNHRPWMDIYSIKGGENWLRAITKAIDECEIFLAILSNNSVSRRGVIQKELKKALDKWEGMLPDDIYIIPIRIDDCPIPDLLKRIHVLDWDNGKGENKLLEAIRIGLARRKSDG